MVLEIWASITSVWNMIPPDLRDWSKSEVLNFVKSKAPGFFNFCRDKISNFWSKVPDGKVKTVVDKTTSAFIALNDKIPTDVKKQLFEQITGSQYNPEPVGNGEALSEVVQTDDEKKAASMQMAYLVAVLGEINQKQEHFLKEYTNSLKITEQLKQEIVEEMKEAEKEFAKFAHELVRLDKEFERISAETAKAKKEANDAIDLI